MGVLEKNLDGLNKRHEIISNNIANVDTPGYKRQSVSFRDQLAQVVEERNKLTITHRGHRTLGPRSLDGVEPRTHTRRTSHKRNDKNNVDVEKEMADLSKNTMEYRTAMRHLSNHFSRLENVINKG